MAGMHSSAYAPPLNYNQPTEVVGGYDAQINPMTGQEIPQTNFARGGNVNSEAGLASLLASRGRNGDSMLVHMAPNEVKGLQSLAMAHGGSLTVNPETGLVEANFLKSLLPTIIGAVLTPLTGGLINPLTAGLLVGGVEGLRTGDIGKGLMAGLGAYGGAGLSSALAGAGAAAKAGVGELAKTAGTEAAAAAAKEGATQAAQEAAKQAAMKEAAQAQIQKQIATKGMFGRLPEGVASFKNIGAGAGEIFKTGGAGLGGIGGTGAAGATLGNVGMIQKAGLTSAGLSALTPEMKPPKNSPIDTSYYESYGYDPEEGRFLGGEWQKNYPDFPGYAEGGEVGVNQNSIQDYKLMPLDPSQAQPNSAKAGWMEFMQKNPNEQKAFIDAGYPASYFQQDPQTFTGARPFIPGKDEALYAEETARIAKANTPQAPAGVAANLEDYMSQLNKFVASPIAAPPRKTPPPDTTPPTRTGPPNRDGFRDFDGVDFSGIDFGNFMGGGMNGLASIINNNFRGNDSRMQWDPDTGSFTQPGMNRPQPPAPATLPQQPSYDFSGYAGRGGRGFDTEPMAYDTSAYQQPEPVYQRPAYQEPEVRDFIPRGMQDEPVFDYAPPATTTPQGYDFIPPNEPIVYDNTPRDVVYDQLGQPGYYNDLPKISEERKRLSEQYGYTSPFSGLPIDALNIAPPTEVFDYTPPVYQPPAYQEPEVRDFIPRTTQDEPVFDYMPSVYEPFAYQQPEPVYTPRGETIPTAPYYQPTYEPTYEPSRFDSFDAGQFESMFAGGGSVQYAAAGKLLRGPGDGMSDDIKANISGKQEARLADGEFVIPADVVSHLGNGSSDAGSRKLYKMMAQIRKARTGKSKQAPAVNVDKYLPA
jgi:hypothetical protein